MSRPFLNFGGNGDKLAVGLALVELVNLVMMTRKRIFRCSRSLSKRLRLSTADQKLVDVLFAFEIRMLEIFGYGLSLHDCSRCGRSVVGEDSGGGFLLLSSGSVMCADCHSSINAGGIKASKGIVQALFRLQSLPMTSLDDLRPLPN